MGGDNGVEVVQKIVYQDRPINSVHWKEMQSYAQPKKQDYAITESQPIINLLEINFRR